MNSEISRLSRRAFLRGGVLASGAVALGMQRARRIVDSHVHFYDPTRTGGTRWPPRDNAALYSPHLPAQYRMATQGLDISGVVVIEAEAEARDNQWVLNLAESEPLILAYIARLGDKQSVSDYLPNPIFRGARIHGEALASAQRHLRELEERRLTLDVVGDAGMLRETRKVAEQFPALRIVIDHLPFDDLSSITSFAGLPSVFAKVSYVLRRKGGKLIVDPGHYRARLDELWKVFGSDRVIYGSNWPVSDLTASYADVYRVVADYVNKYDPNGADKFFWKNSQAAYGWKFRSK